MNFRHTNRVIGGFIVREIAAQRGPVTKHVFISLSNAYAIGNCHLEVGFLGLVLGLTSW